MNAIKNPQHISGLRSELLVAYALAKDYEIYFPAKTQSKCDLVVECTSGNFYKVQVKTASRIRTGKYGNIEYMQIRLGGCGRSKYKEGDFDFLAMVFEERIWLFPWKFVEGNTSMSFPITPMKKVRESRDISQFEVTT